MEYGKKHPLQRALLSLLVVGLLFPCIISSSYAASFSGDTKVAQASVIEAISNGEARDLIVVFDETAAASKAAGMRTAAGMSHDTAEIVSVKAAMYRSMKADTLSAVTLQEVETLKDYKRLPIMFVKVKSLAGLQKLAAQPGVKGIYPNRVMKHFLAQSLPLTNQPAAATAGYTGIGTSVAVLDTGVDYLNPAFGSCGLPGDCLSLPEVVPGCKVACVHDFAPDDGVADDDDHGTNVSAIVAGVAPGTNILGLDVFTNFGTLAVPDLLASEADILSALDWVIENKAVYNITAINMSLGAGETTTPCPSDALALPVAEARAAGILTTIASGNDGLTAATASPACVPAAVSVGAVYDADLGSYEGSCVDDTTAADQITCFSNNAYYTTLLAPGCEITAAGISMCGTSQAAPHVAGAIAVLRGAFPGEATDITVNRLITTGVPIRDERDPDNPIVKPRIDLNNALNAPGLFAIVGNVRTPGSKAGLNATPSKPVKSATITVAGPITATATTDENGDFKITGLPVGTYTVTPSKLNFTFNPSVKSVTIINKNIGLQFFVKTYSILGVIKPVFKKKFSPVANIEMTVSGCDIGAIVLTNAKGKFTVLDLPNCNYSVVPDKTATTGHSFTPDSRAVTVNNKSVKDANFTTP